MLTSQTSSNSTSSLFPTKDVEKIRSLFPCYPEKFKQNLFSRKVFFDIDNYVILIITSRLELIECIEHEVVNYMNLKCHSDFVKDIKDINP